MLTHPPILIFPRSDCTFLLDVDACATGVGVVLSQYVDGKEHVVAYASRALSKVEREAVLCDTARDACFSLGC